MTAPIDPVTASFNQTPAKPIVAENGLIRLPDGTIYTVTITTSTGKKTLDPNQKSLNIEEQKLLKKVAKMLTQIQKEEHFTFGDLSKTKITHEGILTDQKDTTATDVKYTTGNYEKKYQRIQDSAVKILLPPSSTPSSDEKVETMANKLSNNHPLKKNLDVLKKVIAINNLGVDKQAEVKELAKEIAGEIKKLEKAKHKDEVIRLLSDSDLKKKLRLELQLLKEGDLVCELSQGRIKEIDPQTTFTEEQAQNACGSICAEAIFTLAKGEKIDTEQKMYEVIKKGIQAHQNRGVAGKQVAFEDLLKSGLIPGTQDTDSPVCLKAYAPQSTDEKPLSDDEQQQAANPLTYPFQREVKDGFTDLIETLKDLSKSSNETRYGVLTCENHTTMFYFDGKKHVLFDSAGNKYLDVDMGASVLRFDTAEDLCTHLLSKYEENSAFSMLMVGVVEDQQ